MVDSKDDSALLFMAGLCVGAGLLTYLMYMRSRPEITDAEWHAAEPVLVLKGALKVKEDESVNSA